MQKIMPFLVASLFLICGIGCGGDTATSYETEVVETPTQGVITTVKEVSKDNFKIEDELEVDSPSDSRIVTKWEDGTIDTFTLEEARVEEQSGFRGSGFMTAASFGLMGYMMGRSMGSFRPSSGAYVDQRTYDRVSNGAGKSVRNTASRTTVSRPKSGFGSGGSSRSHGG